MKKEQLIKEIESFLAKLKEEDKPKVDFSILNDTDIFYLKCKYNAESEYLFTGNPFNNPKGYNLTLDYEFTNTICQKEVITELRKATDKEIALYRIYYPIKQKYRIFITKDLLGFIHATINRKEIEHELLEVIEREY